MDGINIDTSVIKEAVYNLCINANTTYSTILFEKLTQSYKRTKSRKTGYILKNIELAQNSGRPLCQDTGQVIVFLQIGQNIRFTGEPLISAINEGVKDAYAANFFRKSVVKSPISDRCNTGTNTPAIVYTEIVEGSSVKIDLLVKGAGAENYSNIKMFRPTDTKKEIFEFIKETIQQAGEKACPPLTIGVGIGGTMDFAALLSKKAFFQGTSEENRSLKEELSEYLNNEQVLDINILTSSTHIASLPVAVTLNCHCSRASSAIIEDGIAQYLQNRNSFTEILVDSDVREVSADDLVTLRSLKPGEEILLTGEIYTARDAAHQRIEDTLKIGENLPFDIKDKIIFYAGPCPPAPNEIIGPVGPTTSARMDKFLSLLYEKGFFASIGKGERSVSAQKIIASYNGRYFTAIGGIACYLSQKVKSCECIAFKDLGAEAVYKLYVEKFPIKVEL